MLSILHILPPILTLIIALLSKNILLALALGIVSSSVIVNGFGFIPPILDSYLKDGITGNFDIFIILFLFGPILAAIKRAGGFAAFTQLAEKKLKTAKQARLMTWLMAAVIGLLGDQGMSTIGVGSIMRPITDRHKIPREKLGFILTSTGPAICSMVPYSIFILFYSGLLQSINSKLNGFSEYIKAIPLNFYAIASALVALLFAAGIIPDFGYMKKCEKRAQEKGEVIRPDSHPLSTKELDDMKPAEGVKPSMISFILPFAVIIGGVLIYYLMSKTIVVTYAFLVALIVALYYPVIRGYYKASEIPGLIIDGVKSMVPVIIILILAFTFGKSVNAVGFADVIVKYLNGIHLSVNILPAITFLACGIISYASGSLVTASVIFAPISITLATAMGANLPLVIAACVGGAMFGDQTSPLSDMVVQPSIGAGVDIVDLAKAQFLYKAGFAAIVFLLYLVLGFAL